MGDNGHDTIALSFATEKQLFDELKVRYPDHLFAGVSACAEKNGDLPYATTYHGSYLVNRGLYVCLGEMLSDHSRMLHKDWYCKCQHEEDDE